MNRIIIYYNRHVNINFSDYKLLKVLETVSACKILLQVVSTECHDMLPQNPHAQEITVLSSFTTPFFLNSTGKVELHAYLIIIFWMHHQNLSPEPIATSYFLYNFCDITYIFV